MDIRTANGWKSFKYNKIEFLAIEDRSGNTHIIDSEMNNYGKWQSISSFKTFVRTKGASTFCIGKVNDSIAK